jgi:glyoxylase-like metal-dependent hydrolase (beta-lactamase superfamily II)
MKRVLIALGVLVLLILGLAVRYIGVPMYKLMSKMKQTTTVQYDKQLTLVLGGGGNSGILVSDSAVLVIDTKMDDAALQLSKMVKELAGNKPIIVINTHVHTDHTGGNKYFAGQTIIAGGNYQKEFWAKEAGDSAPPTVWVKDSLVFNIGDETVTVLNLPFAAHTQSDIMVYLHNRKMLFGGDVILNKQAPALFAKYNADADGYLKAFDLVQKRFDIAKVVPGHGAVGGPEVIDNFRTYFKDIESAVADPSKEKEVLKKYSDYGQVPFLMSPGATLRYIRNSAVK